MANFDLKMNLNEISLEDIASWPWIVRAVCIGLTCFIIVWLVYAIDNKQQIQTLHLLKGIEAKLKTTFESKQQDAANYDAYQLQLVEIKKTLGGLLQQLPNQTEVPGLLEDISALGHANGLKFTLFKPLPETQLDFYAKLPIKIIIQGTYHQLGQFVSDLAMLDRIVTIDDFQILQNEPTANNNTTNNNDKDSVGKLNIDLTAHTYRYIDKVPK